MFLTAQLPTNVAYQGASPAPSSQTGTEGAILTWDSAALGGCPYSPGDPPVDVVITGAVTDCDSDRLAVVDLEYGCSETDRCFGASGTHSLRTLPSIPALSPRMGLELNACGGHMRLAVTNVGATATGIVIRAVAPDGYIFAAAGLTGSFHAADAILTPSGTPNWSIVDLDLTTTNSSGVSSVNDMDGNPETLELVFAEGFVVDFELISAGYNLDFTANPLDYNYEDPDPPLPSQVTGVSTLVYWSVCGDMSEVNGSVQAYPDSQDLDLDLQPNCSAITNGQTVAFTLNVRNDAQRGDAENFHIRMQFGTAWTNLSVVSTTIVESGSGSIVIEQQGDTNLLVDLPGVVLDPVDDRVTLELQATVGGTAGSLAVLAEVVGDCDDSRIVAQYAFTNTLGNAPLADTMTGSVVAAVNGQYYSFDQDMSSLVGTSLEKTIRLNGELLAAAGAERDARIGEEMLVHLKATFFGAVFSNIVVAESLPPNLVFGTPFDYSFDGAITNAVYDPGSGVFTIQPQVVTAFSLAVFEADIPVTVSNRADNQNGVVITNTATYSFQVAAFTNPIPHSSALTRVYEPVLSLSKRGGTNQVRSGDIVMFTNTVWHAVESATNAFNLVFRDTLPQGLSFSGMDLTSDGLDNNGNGDIDEPLEGTLIQSETELVISYTNDPGLTNLPLGSSLTFVFPALVTNQIVGGTMTNVASLTWMSLQATNGNERTGAGGLNDYAASDTWTIRSLPLGAVTKTFVQSSQTNTADSATNDFTIGERVVYAVTVNVPEGVVSNMTITDIVPPGMDWVGPNTNSGLAYPGYGYFFDVPAAGPKVPTNTAEGLVITDPDPTPADSSTLDGSGSNVTFRFPPFTNTVDGSGANDYFVLNMEFALLNAATNLGLSTPPPFTNRNFAVVSDAFNSGSATGPWYRVVEPDIRVAKTVAPTNADAGDTMTITLVVSNRSQALSEAYHVVVTDFLPAGVFDAASYVNVSGAPGWGASNFTDASGLTHYFFSSNDVALLPGQRVTNIFAVNLADTVAPSRIYTNRVVAFCDGLHDSAPSGVVARADGWTNQAAFSIPGMSLAKSLYATSETNDPPDSTNDLVQIGEAVIYELAAALPETTISNLTFTELLPTGMAFVVGSVAVDTSTFNGVLPGAPDVTPNAGMLGANGAPVIIRFTGDTWVNSDGNPALDVLRVRLTAVVLDTNTVRGLPPRTFLTNGASLTYSSNPVAPTQAVPVVVSVIEPTIALSKSLSTNRADAGDTITVTLRLTNSGTAAGYDLQITDSLLPAKFDPATVVTGSVPAGFVMVASNESLYVRSDPSSPAGANAIEPGESLAFTFDVKVAATLPPNAIITNTAVAQVDSIALTNVYAVQRYNFATGSASYTAGDFTLTKRLYTTSETNNPPDSTNNLAQIGEIVTYELEALLPEGTITNLAFTDRVPTGMAFVVGSVVVDTGSFDGTLSAGTNITPNVGLRGGNGETVVITFQGNTWVRDDNDPVNDVLKIRLSSVVLNTNTVRGLPPQTLLTNTASVTYQGNPNQPVTSTAVVMRVIEPQLSLQKRVSTNSVDAGDPVVITLLATNSGTASAYDLEFRDALNPWFDPASVVAVSVPTGFVLTASNNSAYIRSDAGAPPGANSLAAGESLAVSFSVNAAQSLAPNMVFTNRAILTADSINLTNAMLEWRSYSQTGQVALATRNIALSKSLYSSSETNDPPDSTNAFAQIGEIFTFELSADLPEGTIGNLVFTDYLPTGMAFAVSSLVVDASSFSGTVAAVTNVTPNSGALGQNGGSMAVTFEGDTVIWGDNDPSNNLLRLRLQAIVLDTNTLSGLPPRSVLTNAASLTFAGNPSNAVYSGQVLLTCIEPTIALSKNLSTNRADAGDTITVTLRLTNSGTAAGYDLQIMDSLLPAKFDPATVVTGSVPAGFVMVASNDSLYVRSDPSAPAGANAIEPGESLAFTFDVKVAAILPPNAIITNTAVAQVDSIALTNVYAVQRYNFATGSASYTAGDFTLIKRLYTTSETNNPPDSTNHLAQIGEIVTYELEALLPEGTIANLAFTDHVPTGMAFVVGSVVVDTGSFDGTLSAGTNITPNVGLRGADGEDVVITFQGNTWVRDDNDPVNDVLKIRLSSVVLNTNTVHGLPPQSLLTNTASVTYQGNPNPPAASTAVVMRVIEPQLSLQKRVSTNSVDAGDPVVITLLATNSGAASAYDLEFTDALSPWFDPASVVAVSVPTGFVLTASNNSAYIRSDANAPAGTNSLAAGESLAVSFSVNAAQSLAPNMVFTNRAILTADSINLTNAMLEWRSYSQTGQVALATRNIALSKSLYSSSEQGPADSTNALAQIGEIFTFELSADLPEGTIGNLVFTDYLPTGMAFAVSSLVVDASSFSGTVAAVTNVTPDSGALGQNGGSMAVTFEGDTVIWGDNDPSNNLLRLRLQAIVLDTNTLSGLPPQSVLTNTASLTFAGNPSNAAQSTDVLLTCIEPDLSLFKQMAPASCDAGDWITSTLSLTNSGTGSAYDIAITDLVAGVNFDISTVSMVSTPTGFVFSVSTNGPDATVAFASDPVSGAPTNTIEAGEFLAFSFRARLSQSVAPGAVIANAARVSRADTIGGTNVFAIARDKSGAWAEAATTVSNMSFAKSLLGTTETGPADTTGADLAIGEAAIFGLHVMLPECTVSNLTLVDSVPVGMAYVPGSASVDTTGFAGSLPGAPAVSGGGGGDSLTILFAGATVVSNDNLPGNNSFVVSFHLRALDVPGNDGVPPSAGGAGPTLLTNSATATFVGLPAPASGGTVVVTIVEPALSISKTFGTLSNGWVNLEFAITNRGLASAFDLILDDMLPTSIWQTATLAPAAMPTGFVWSVLDLGTAAVLQVASDPAIDPPTNCVPAGSNLLVSFDVLLQPGIISVITNIAAITNYTTIAGPSLFERIEPYVASTAVLAPPGVDIVKSLVSPLGREAEVGETVVFDLLVTNTTVFGLAEVRIEDDYPSATLAFISASVAPDSSVPGMLVWTNAGPLDAGAVTSISVSFTALAGTWPGQATNAAAVIAITTNGIPIPPVIDNAPVVILAQSFRLDKELVSPAGRPADLGETVVFRMSVTNDGDSVLETVRVADSFDSGRLAFVSGEPAGYTTAVNVVVWTNIGVMSPGDSVVLTARFTAAAGTLPGATTNTAVGSAITAFGMPLPPQTSSAPVQIAVPDYVLAKSLISPTGRPAIVSETLVFHLCVSNTGQVALGPLDLDDAYPTNVLRFLGANPAPAAHDPAAGSIAWSNLGYIAIASSICVTARFEAIAANAPDPSTNAVFVFNLTTTNGIPVPPSTNTEPFLINVPSALGGTVWYDWSLDGILDPGEPRLSNVAVRLYGPQTNLLSQTATDPDGRYLFTNLVSGPYSVFFSRPGSLIFTLMRKGSSPELDSDADVAGWTDPLDLAVAETNTTLNAGLYEPAHIFGLAWNDVNANGIREPGEPLLSGALVSLYTNGIPVWSVTTGVDGAYAFTNLMPLTYRMRAVIPADFVFSPQHQGGNPALDSDFNPADGWCDPISLDFGQVVTNVDVGAYRPTAQLALFKSVVPENILPGSNALFVLTLTNSGPNAASAIEISEALSPHFIYIGHVGDIYDPVPGLWSVSELAAGSSTGLWITVTVTNEGCFTNRAWIGSVAQYDPDETDNEASAAVCAEDDSCLTLIAITVAPIDAEWTLSGPPEFNGPVAGAGSLAETNIPPGVYTLEFGSIPGWRSPNAMTRMVEECSSVVFTGLYLRICCSGDYDGDGITDMTVYDERSGTWYSLSPDGRIVLWAEQWGGPGMTPMRGDFDGDGVADLAVYQEALDGTYRSTWYIRALDGRTLAWDLEWGCVGWLPMVADFNGDGACDIAVYSPDTGEWYITTLFGEILAAGMPWGGAGMEPVRGDFDGDGASDLAAFDTVGGLWYAMSLQGRLLLWAYPWGASSWAPASGHYKQSRITDLGVYDPAGAWFLIAHHCNCIIAWDIRMGGFGFVPVNGDYDGDGIDDLALYHEATGSWYVLSIDGRVLIWSTLWGGPGFVPVR